jgi:CubicO group peptidase (beta-lactamase class C family)
MDADLQPRLMELGRRGHRATVAGVIAGDERACGCRFPLAQPVDERSLFEIGSITKAFTGVLLADMVLAGEVALEDPLSRHLPGRRPAWRYREPTLLELATHRTGLPNTPGPMHRRELAHALGFGAGDPWVDVTPDDYERLVACESPRRAPGGSFRYSSLAVGLLGDALAARAGTTYEELLVERVLRPLEMHTTAVRVAPALVDVLVDGHSRRGQPRPPIEDFMQGAGSLRSSLDEMMKFLSACLHPPAEPPGPALTFAHQPQARIGHNVDVGLCWMISIRRGHPKVIWHNGGTWGFRSFAAFAPEIDQAAVVLSNSARSVDRLGFKLIDSRPQPREAPVITSARRLRWTRSTCLIV